MLTARIQNELKSKGVSYKGYEMLRYLTDTYFTNLKGADLQKLRPLVFREAKDVRQAYDELVSAELISGEWNLGSMKNIVPNTQELLKLSDLGAGITIVKEEKKEKRIGLPADVADIFKAYNSHQSLPRPSTPTPLAVKRVEDKLKIFSPEQIKDALEFASNAEWLVNKSSEGWCNASWVFNVIDGFMPGGKYNNTSSAPKTSAFVGVDDDDSIIVW
jgi:hypothetical protein